MRDQLAAIAEANIGAHDAVRPDADSLSQFGRGIHDGRRMNAGAHASSWATSVAINVPSQTSSPSTKASPLSFHIWPRRLRQLSSKMT